MEAVVAETFVGQPLKGRRVGGTTKRASLTEANVIEQDSQYVGCAGRRRRH